jgi:heterodisulfide reductase subunit A-like polyferredoxin
MDFPWGNAAKLIVASLVGLAASHSHSSINIANYKQEDIITRDVCIIGGGSTGTYSAVRLGDFNKSVIVVEINKWSAVSWALRLQRVVLQGLFAS